MDWLERAFTDHRAVAYATAHGILRDREAAEDVVQEVFLRLGRDGRFDASRGPLVAFVRMAARSRALDVLRRGKAAERTRERFARAEPPGSPGQDDPGTAAVATADRDRLRAAVRALPELQREAVALAFWGDMTQAEVAVRTGTPVGTAKSRVRLGLQRLRDDVPLADAA